MGDHNEPTYEEVKREAWSTSDGSIQKMSEPSENMPSLSLIYGRLRDLKLALDDGNDIVSDLFAKFDSVLSPETDSNENPSSDANVLSTNSELYDAIGQLERHVRKQHSQLRYLMERCEL